MSMRLFYLLYTLLPLCIAYDIKNLVVFGDSYSDTGNLQRLTNGPLWSEHLAVGWNTTLYSFAFNGAMCDTKLYSNISKDAPPSIKDQIEMYYLEDMNLDPLETVYSFWIGLADIQKTLLDQEEERDSTVPDITKVIECLSQQMRTLRKVFGANKIIALNVPPMELMPYFQDLKSMELWENASVNFNTLLEKDIISLNRHHSALQLDNIDVHGLIKDIVDDPTSFGFSNAKDAYWDICQGQCKQDIDTFLWWDKIHLTGAAHRVIANSILISGSLQSSTSLGEDVNVKKILSQTKSVHRSPIYSPKYSSGIVEKKAKTIMEEKEKASKNPLKEEIEDYSEDELKDKEEISDGDYVNQIYIGMIVIALFCIGFVYFSKKRRTSNLAALSNLMNNRNQGRGRFIPLRSVETHQ